MFVVVVIVGDVPRLTTETSTITAGSVVMFGFSWHVVDGSSLFFGEDSFSLDLALVSASDDDDDDVAELDFELSSLANRRLVLRTDASFAFIYDNAELLPRELTELLLPP